MCGKNKSQSGRLHFFLRAHPQKVGKFVLLVWMREFYVDGWIFSWTWKALRPPRFLSGANRISCMLFCTIEITKVGSKMNIPSAVGSQTADSQPSDFTPIEQKQHRTLNVFVLIIAIVVPWLSLAVIVILSELISTLARSLPLFPSLPFFFSSLPNLFFIQI